MFWKEEAYGRFSSFSRVYGLEGLSFDSTDKEESQLDSARTRCVSPNHSTIEPNLHEYEVPSSQPELDEPLERENRAASISTEAVPLDAEKGYRIYDIIPSHTIEGDMDSSAKSTLRKGGIEELSSTNGRKRALPAKELQSHVPSEVTVTKYGYIEHRVIGVLDSILDYGGFLSAATRKSVSFDHIEVSPNGRDINILYHIHKFSHDDSIRRSLSLEEEEEFDNLRSLWGNRLRVAIANERYVKERRNRSAPSSSLLEVGALSLYPW